MSSLLVCALSLSLLSPQQAEPIFVKREVASVDGGPVKVTVTADKRGINCLVGLQQLADTMNWNLAVESTPLENDLRFAPIDLNLADQTPRMVAQLLAVAGGADAIFDEPAGFEGARVTLHVVRVPSGETESGRQRLRAIAGQWYRSFLKDELQFEPIVQDKSVEVRMHLGQLLIDSGDLENAIVFFSDVYDRRPHDDVGPAILKLAECHLDLAKGCVDREAKLKQCIEAEKWVRRVFEGMPSSQSITPATILLGRALLGQAQAQPDRASTHIKAQLCQDELRARVIRLLDSIDLLKVWLIAGHAQFLMERPERTYNTMMSLRESAYFDDLLPSQFLDYHFLLGFGALGVGKYDLSMRALEWFLIHSENDDRRGQAYVMLAEVYLAQDRFVQSHAASIEARTKFLSQMNSDWRQRTFKVWARSALALGEKEGAFFQLEQMVLRADEPELTLFLVDELLVDNQWQRAMSIASILAEREDSLGDQARFKMVQALYEQARASKHMDDFPAQAIAIAPKVTDPELRSQIATMIGEAYTTLQKLEHAADAFRGILR